MCDVSLEQCSSNFTMPHNHLKALKIAACWILSPVSSSVDLGWLENLHPNKVLGDVDVPGSGIILGEPLAEAISLEHSKAQRRKLLP